MYLATNHQPPRPTQPSHRYPCDIHDTASTSTDNPRYTPDDRYTATPPRHIPWCLGCSEGGKRSGQRAGARFEGLESIAGSNAILNQPRHSFRFLWGSIRVRGRETCRSLFPRALVTPLGPPLFLCCRSRSWLLCVVPVVQQAARGVVVIAQVAQAATI